MMLYIPDVHRFAVAIHCLKDTNSLKPKMTIVTQWAHQLPLRFSGFIQSFFWDNVTTPLLRHIFSKKTYLKLCQLFLAQEQNMELFGIFVYQFSRTLWKIHHFVR
jgi:hypothetical protein